MGILDKLRSMGIGVKSPYEIERDANPGMNQFKSRGGAASYEDIKQQEALNRQAGVTLKRFDGKLKSGEKIRNIYGVSYVVPAGGGSGYDTPSPTPAATSYSNDFESAGGPVPRGMFSNPLVQNEEVPYYLRSPETDSVRQAVEAYGGGMMPYEGQDQTANNNRVQRGEVTPQEYVDNAAKTWGVHPSNFVAPGDNFQNQGKPEPIPSWIDAMNERFAGNRQAELPNFLDSMFANQFPEGISKSLFTPNPQSITNNVPENQKNALIDIYNAFSGGVPQGKYNVPDEVPFDPVAAQIRTEKANIKAEMISERTDPETAMYGAAVVTPAEVDREYAIRKNIQSYGNFPDAFGGNTNYMDTAPQFDVPPAIVREVGTPYALGQRPVEFAGVSEPAPRGSAEIRQSPLEFAGVSEPEYFQASSARPVERVFDLSVREDETAMLNQGYLSYGESAVTAASESVGRELSFIEKQVAMDEGFASVPYKDSKGNLTVGAGLTKEYFTDNPEELGSNFVRAVSDKVAKLKKSFGPLAYPKDEKKQAALVSLSYRGDVGPKWTKHFKEGRSKQAQQELWNSDEFRTLLQKENKTGKASPILNRVRRNEEVLFGRKTIVPFNPRARI
jgi:GH24 family phage-related lysozyme (muramidase)